MQHHRTAKYNYQRQTWHWLFLCAIMLSSLPPQKNTIVRPIAEIATAAPVQSHSIAPLQTEQANLAINTARNNPHPPSRVTVSPLSQFSFNSRLTGRMDETAYLILPATGKLAEMDWSVKTRNTDWSKLSTNLTSKTTSNISPLLSLFQPKPLPKPKEWIVMIDPGHGGSDPGSVTKNGLIEKVLTLDIARRAAKFLAEEDGIKVVLTRDTDQGMSRQSRVDRVKRVNADLVVSLHFNHLPQSDINLVETFYAGQQNIAESQAKQMAERGEKPVSKTRTASLDYPFIQHSERLAKIMQSRIHNEVMLNDKDAINAGVKQDTLYILTRSFIPGVLIELSCLSHDEEATRLITHTYRAQLAAALADGIREYVDASRSADTASDFEV